MYDVVALGELLIDFCQHDGKTKGNLYEANPGGAPCNVLAMVTKLGGKTAFIGKVGKDVFGDNLIKTVKDLGIDVTGLKVDNDVHTTLAIVSTDESGDRSFSFYRNPGADMMLTEEEVNLQLIKESRIFHFGTLSMTHEGICRATEKAVDYAKRNGCIISFDPNLRRPLWNDLSLAKKKMQYGCSKCNILKIENEELEFLTGASSIQIGVKMLVDSYNIDLIFLTSGVDGCIAFYKGMEIPQKAFLQDVTIDTTGAGDTFFGSCLSYLCKTDLQNLTEEDLKEMIRFASAAASIVTTKKGALCVMPSKEEVDAFLKLI